MPQITYRRETIKNIMLTATVWETPEGWTAKGVATEDRGNEVHEHSVYPPQDYYPDKKAAGEAVWQVLKDGVVD